MKKLKRKNWGRGGARTGAGRREKTADQLRESGASPARVKERFEKELAAGIAESRSPILFRAWGGKSNSNGELPRESDSELSAELIDILIVAGFEVPKSTATAKNLIGEVLSHLGGVEKLRAAANSSVIAALELLTETQLAALRRSCEASLALRFGDLGLKQSTAASMAWFDSHYENGLMKPRPDYPAIRNASSNTYQRHGGAR